MVRRPDSAFPGVTKMHSSIMREIVVAMEAQFRGTPFRLFMCQVLTATPRSVRYPDIVVTCDERDTRDTYSRTRTFLPDRRSTRRPNRNVRSWREGYRIPVA